ncbi:MAG: DMT family transporter, partial [Pseudomonadota bacterium]
MAGAFAILCWALLAFLTVGTDGIPPFQTAAVAFAVGATVGVILALAPRGRRSKPRRTPWAAIFFSSLGLFGYHALYFSALKSAPAAEASLIAYLWPVLIVIGSALVPGERLRWFHILGACAGFAGCALLIGSSGGLGFSSQFIFGYTLAFAAAFTWSGYSLGSRMFADVPTRFVTISCAVAAILSSAISLTFERWVHEPTLMQ